MDIFILVVLAFAAFLGFFGMLALLFKEARQRRKARKLSESQFQSINQITVNCDADGNVTVVTDYPSKVRVERRS